MAQISKVDFHANIIRSVYTSVNKMNKKVVSISNAYITYSVHCSNFHKTLATGCGRVSCSIFIDATKIATSCTYKDEITRLFASHDQIAELAIPHLGIH